MTEFDWLQNWYASQCNGTWEHSYGVRIDTLDNPGWTVKIDLKDTRWASMSERQLTEEVGDDDWLHCVVKGLEFLGTGDPSKLQRIVATFRRWVEESV